jgi:two-component system KDP operon response regulator KdpE
MARYLMPSVLVIEEDRQNRRLLQVTLRKGGFHILTTNGGGNPLSETIAPDLIIMDIDGMEGDALVRLHRLHHDAGCPVIVLSSREREQDIVRSLESGADDYIVKPFRTGELIARSRVALRRRTAEVDESPCTVGSLTMDFHARTIRKGMEETRLTQTENELLLLLVRNAGKVLTHRYILEQIWGTGATGKTVYLRVYIGHLRKKLGDDSPGSTHILTASGIGYGWVMDPVAVQPS